MMDNISLLHLTKTVIGIDRLLDSVQSTVSATTSTGFPPYNITRYRDDDSAYTVTLAIAGYAKEDIEITQEGCKLEITGKASKEEDVIYLHKGLTQKGFRRILALHEYSVVTDSFIENGLLSINIRVETPDEKKPRKIVID